MMRTLQTAVHGKQLFKENSERPEQHLQITNYKHWKDLLRSRNIYQSKIDRNWQPSWTWQTPRWRPGTRTGGPSGRGRPPWGWSCWRSRATWPPFTRPSTDPPIPATQLRWSLLPEPEPEYLLLRCTSAKRPPPPLPFLQLELPLSSLHFSPEYLVVDLQARSHCQPPSPWSPPPPSSPRPRRRPTTWTASPVLAPASSNQPQSLLHCQDKLRLSNSSSTPKISKLNYRRFLKNQKLWYSETPRHSGRHQFESWETWETVEKIVESK